MAFWDFFTKINGYLEDKYSKILDFLEQKGLGAYKYNDWLETHGVPAMWFTIFMIVAVIITGVVLTFFLISSSVSITINIEDNLGNPINDSVSLSLQKDYDSLYSDSVKTGTKFDLKGLSIGDSVIVSAVLPNYDLVSNSSVTINATSMTLHLIFKKTIQKGTTKIRLINKDTGSIIADANVSLSDSTGLIRTVQSDQEGYVSFSDVPINSTLKLKVESDGYSTFDSEILLSSDTKDIALESTSLNSNESGQFKFTVTSNSEPLQDAQIVVYDNKTRQKIGEVTTDIGGVALLNAPKGTTIRFIVKKDGFLDYDSNLYNILRTIVSSTEEIKVSMTVGGSSIKVVVGDNTTTLSNSQVSLYTRDGLVLDSKKTDIYGVADFNGIDSKRLYYISSVKEGYYPNTIRTDNNLSYTINLEKQNLLDSSQISLFVVDSSNKPVNDAKLSLYRLDGSSYVPLELSLSSSAIGLVDMVLKPDNNYRVVAESPNLEGSIDIYAKKGRDTYTLMMESVGGLVRANLYDSLGNPMIGATVNVKSKTGVSLFDGISQDGHIEFVANGFLELQIDVIDSQNNLYSKIVKTAKVIDIRFTKSDALDKPIITFLGVYNASDSKVNSVQKGKSYNLRFRVAWPEFIGNGAVNIRLGQDGVSYDKQDYGIYGASSPNATYSYGLYYSPYENDFQKDLGVTGRSGIKNKWVQLDYDSPSGVNEIDVKVKINQNTDVNDFVLNYRALIVKDKSVLRDPEDSVLGTNDSIQSKNGLYALSKSENLRVTSNEVECENQYCISYSFRDEVSGFDSFYPVTGNVYALDMDIVPNVDDLVDISFTTNNITKSAYLNNVILNPDSFSPLDNQRYDLDASNVKFEAGQATKIRLYFTTAGIGSSFIKLRVNGKSTVDKTIDFTVSDKKDLGVTLSKNGLINLGDDLFVTVQDNKGPISQSNIYVTDSKDATVYYSKGDGTQDNGLNGVYKISNLASGEYKVIVKTTGYITREVGFIVTRIGMLDLPSEIVIKIPKGTDSIRYNFDIRNTSNIDIKSLQYGILREDANNFTYKILLSRSYVQSKDKTTAIVELSSNGSDTLYGDVDLVLSGMLDNREIVRAKTHLKFVSNTDYDDSCLEVNPDQLKINLPDFPNSSQDVSFILTNNCIFNLDISPEMVFRDNTVDPKIRFDMKTLVLKIGEKKELKGKVVNLDVRDSEGQVIDSLINLKTSYFNKQIPAVLDVWKTNGALLISVPNVIFAYSENPEYFPITITNSGNLPINNIRVYFSRGALSMLGTSSAGLGYVPENYVPGLSSSQSYANYDDRLFNQLGVDTPFQNTADPWFNQSYPSPARLDSYNSIELRYPYLYAPYDQSMMSNQNGFMQNNYPAQYNGLDQYNTSYNPFVQSGSHQFLFDPNIITKLDPGQSIVVRTTLRSITQKSNAQTTYTIVGTGKLDGASSPLQSYSITQVVSSGYDCLKPLSNQSSPYIFVSSKLSESVNPKLVKIQNNCNEPVVVMGLSLPDSLGQNGLSLKPSNNSNIILPRTVGEFSLEAYARSDVDLKNVRVLAFARTLNSQKSMFLPLYVEMHFGRTATTNIGARSEPVQRVESGQCDSSDTQVLYVPKISNDCSIGYCDSESFSKFLVQKITNYIDSYKSKYNDISKSGSICSNSSSGCLFSDYGVATTRFDMYFMNDKLSDRYLSTLLSNQKTINLKAINVYSSDFDITSQYSGGVLFIPTTFGKCGLYEVELEGAFSQISGVPQPDSYNVLVKATYAETKECKVTAGNASVFLPKDSSTDSQNAYGFMPAYVDYKDSELSTLAKDLSKSLFGIERIDSGKPNTLVISKGDAKSNIDVSVSQNGDSVNVNVLVNKDLVVNDNSPNSDKVRKDLISSIESYLYKGSFNGCISPGGSAVRIESAGKTDVRTGQVRVTGCDSLKFSDNMNAYCDFTITSSGANNKFKVKFESASDAGIDSKITDLETSKDADSVSLSYSSSGSLQKTLRLEVSTKDVSNSIIKSRGFGSRILILTLDGKDTYARKDIAIDVCSLTPEDFTKSVINKRVDKDLFNKTYSSIINWPNTNKDKYSVCEVLSSQKELAQGPDYILTSAQCPNLYSQKSYVNTLTKNMTDAAPYAAGWSATICVAADSGILWLTGGLAAPKLLFDCGIGVGASLAGTYYHAHRLALENGVGTRNYADTIRDGLNKFFKGAPNIPVIKSLFEYISNSFYDYSDKTLIQKQVSNGSDLKSSGSLLPYQAIDSGVSAVSNAAKSTGNAISGAAESAGNAITDLTK